MPGFMNVDIDKHDGVDYQCDVSNLSKIFAENSVSELYASHILEHFPHMQTLDILKGWNMILEPQGILYIGVPDFKRAVDIYNAMGLQNWIINFMWGDQCYKTAFHFTAFDENRLRILLRQAGFSDISRVEYFPFKTSDCSTNKSNLDGKPVSLNMIAIK